MPSVTSRFLSRILSLTGFPPIILYSSDLKILFSLISLAKPTNFATIRLSVSGLEGGEGGWHVG